MRPVVPCAYLHSVGGLFILLQDFVQVGLAGLNPIAHRDHKVEHNRRT